MNQLVRTLAKAHQALIEENPVEVTITYKIKEREGGGWRDRTEVVGPIRPDAPEASRPRAPQASSSSTRAGGSSPDRPRTCEQAST
jgi:hypothetical protein